MLGFGGGSDPYVTLKGNFPLLSYQSDIQVKRISIICSDILLRGYCFKYIENSCTAPCLQNWRCIIHLVLFALYNKQSQSIRNHEINISLLPLSKVDLLFDGLVWGLVYAVMPVIKAVSTWIGLQS